MEEQVSWKGQSFTLLVFCGIVFLCSIFFVLGMLVGRGQPPRSAEAAAAKTETSLEVEPSRSSDEIRKPELPIRKSVEPEKAPAIAAVPAPQPAKASAPPPVEVPSAKPASKPAPAPKTVSPPAPAATPAKSVMIYLQVAALEKSAAANKELDELRKKGFTALISSGEGANKLFRVKVGPFSNAADADIAKHKLEALGYKPIKK